MSTNQHQIDHLNLLLKLEMDRNNSMREYSTQEKQHLSTGRNFGEKVASFTPIDLDNLKLNVSNLSADSQKSQRSWDS